MSRRLWSRRRFLQGLAAVPLVGGVVARLVRVPRPARRHIRIRPLRREEIYRRHDLAG